MNKRILKKLSKRAEPLLAALGRTPKEFYISEGDSYTSSTGHDRKHWERNRARYPLNLRGEIHIQPRTGEGVIVLDENYLNPWPGTVMLGWMVGYYEPEWEEDDAWSFLKSLVRDTFMEVREVPESDDGLGCPAMDWVCLRRLRNPSQILRAVPELIAQHQEKLRDRAELARRAYEPVPA